MPADSKDGGVSDAERIDPFSVRIPTAMAMTGFSRSRLYELIAAGEIQIAKDRRCTLILVSSLREAVRRRLVNHEQL